MATCVNGKPVELVYYNPVENKPLTSKLSGINGDVI
jgi:hypothetical protein